MDEREPILGDVRGDFGKEEVWDGTAWRLLSVLAPVGANRIGMTQPMTREQMIDAAVRRVLTFPGLWARNIDVFERNPGMVRGWLPRIQGEFRKIAGSQPRLPNGRFARKASQ